MATSPPHLDPDRDLTVYEAYEDTDGTLTLSTEEECRRLRRDGLLDPKSELLYRFRAASPEEAMAIHGLRQGWVYRPFGEGTCTCGSVIYASGMCWKCGRKS